MNERKVAYECLKSIRIDHTYSNLCLRTKLAQAEVQQRPYITQIVYGTLENYRYVRWCWEGFVNQLPKEDVCILLDMAVYELLWMKTKPYALINETVQMAKRLAASYAGMVNAVLRRVSEQGRRLLPENEKEALAIRTSHPLWLIQMWTAQYGEAICKKICEGNLKPRKSVGRVNTLKITRDELCKIDSQFQPSETHEDAVIYEKGNIAHTTWFQEGYVSIQDEASQMIAPLLDPKPSQCVLDVCSAPGTKACHIAQLMHDTGEILCGDIHPHRVTLIEEGARRLGIRSIHARCMDATVLDGLEPASFDRVLCDVPCSGYGTLARKSDIKVHMQSSDMDTLIPLQREILECASTMVKDGGILVYSTCTLNKKENEKQVTYFLQKHPDYVLEEAHTIFPFTFDCDGFYMAKLRKAGGMYDHIESD